MPDPKIFTWDVLPPLKQEVKPFESVTVNIQSNGGKFPPAPLIIIPSKEDDISTPPNEPSVLRRSTAMMLVSPKLYKKAPKRVRKMSPINSPYVVRH